MVNRGAAMEISRLDVDIEEIISSIVKVYCRVSKIYRYVDTSEHNIAGYQTSYIRYQARVKETLQYYHLLMLPIIFSF